MTEKTPGVGDTAQQDQMDKAMAHVAGPTQTTRPSEQTSVSAHMTFFLCGAMVVSFSVWASISTLDIVSMATGEVIPSTQVKTIQHLEGGIIREIHVREGETVTEGQEALPTLIVKQHCARCRLLYEADMKNR